MNHIRKLAIENFKSIRHVTLECERVNIFLGKPNAGKSNILEAISLLGAGRGLDSKFMKGFIRYKTLRHCFNDYNVNEAITVSTNEVVATLGLFGDGGYKFSLDDGGHEGQAVRIDD